MLEMSEDAIMLEMSEDPNLYLKVLNNSDNWLKYNLK